MRKPSGSWKPAGIMAGFGPISSRWLGRASTGSQGTPGTLCVRAVMDSGCWRRRLKVSLTIREETVAGVTGPASRRTLTPLRGASFSSPSSEWARGLREASVSSWSIRIWTGASGHMRRLSLWGGTWGWMAVSRFRVGRRLSCVSRVRRLGRSSMRAHLKMLPMH